MNIKMKYFFLLSIMTIVSMVIISGCIGQNNNGGSPGDNKTVKNQIKHNDIIKTNNSNGIIKTNNSNGIIKTNNSNGIIKTNNSNGIIKANNSNEIKFMVVGDPHIKSSNGGMIGGNERLKTIVSFADSSDVDFVVLLGDIADDGKNKTYNIAVQILKNMTKPYYVIVGNHDIFDSNNAFESKFGPMEDIENVKGYQLLFIGMSDDKSTGKTILHWAFDFNKTNKSKPTLVFLHGPTVKPPTDAISCRWGIDFFGYGQTMQPELNTFPNLIAEYSGHVHYDTDQTINGVRYVTVNGLVDKAGGCENAGASGYVGYSDIKDGKADYILINYSEPFTNPFPN